MTTKTDKNKAKYNQNLAQDYLRNIIKYSPGYLYLKDSDFKYIICNDNFAQAAGLKYPEEIAGKTDFELAWGKTEAKLFRKGDMETLLGLKKTDFEEPQLQANGERKIVLANKVPLYDQNNNIIGILGTYIDITSRKYMEEELKAAKDTAESALQAMKQAQLKEEKQRQTAEQFQIENSIHLAQLDAQRQFTTVANQVAHDIRSPLSSLLMIVKACSEIPEKERIALRAAGLRINDIANNLLQKYKPEASEALTYGHFEAKKVTLISAALMQSLTEKKYEYQDYPVEFNCQIEQSGQFAFVKIEPASFGRMISNLINNAIDAFENSPGKVWLKMDASNEWLNIVIADNGKGMSNALIEKIENNTVVTEGKIDGNGLGLTQARETLARNHGTLCIQSQPGKGTEMQLTFPRVPAPLWVAEELILLPQDKIMILDDDHSIHGAWDSRFEPLIRQAPGLQLFHFERAQEALTFIDQLSEEEKAKIYLLTDFELLKQDLNGLEVIAESKIKRTMLVTSHYMEYTIQKQAIELNVKILPKQLASEIPIWISSLPTQTGLIQMKTVNAVWLEDNEEFVFAQSLMFKEEDKVDVYKSPHEFMQHIEQYCRETPVFLDNNFEIPFEEIHGVEIAKQLHEMGFTKLFLTSGQRFNIEELPPYLRVIYKDEEFDLRDHW